MSAGSVHVYLLDEDGRPVGSQHVAEASKVDRLTALLEQTVARLQVPAGPPLVRPAPQSAAPKADPDALVLHLVARNVTRRGGEDVPHKSALGTTGSIGWGSYPVEDWIVLIRAESRRLIPTRPAGVGTTWEPDRDVMAKLLRHFYPSTENNDAAKNRIDRQELKATIVSVNGPTARARLDGTLRMKHPFYHKDDDYFVDATLLGFLDFDTSTGRVLDLQLATTEATYGRTRFGVAVRAEGRK
jgi:hypothetical protein